MLPDFTDYDNVWVEITSADDDHGGTGWGFGTCLWSPATDSAGRNRYEVMWSPQPGDLVLHFYKFPWNNGMAFTQLCGYSLVQAACHLEHTPPPNPGAWHAAAYYRIDLESYQALPSPLNPQDLNGQPALLAQIREELIPNRPNRYPFATYGEGVRLTQGQYLTQCTANLYGVLRAALGHQDAVVIAPGEAASAGDSAIAKNEEYKEGQRKMRETNFFVRNPKLAADSKKARNYICEVCAFNFLDHYGDIGKEFAECHHKNPLSERPREMWTHAVTTTLADVAVVCANCHRMLHRERPALTIAQLIEKRKAAKAG